MNLKNFYYLLLIYNNMIDIKNFENLEYDDKLKLYNRIFSFGFLPSFKDKLMLISLVALVTKQIRLKTPDVNPLEILMKITSQKRDDSQFYQFLEALSVLVEDLSYACSDFESYGYTESSKIIKKIKDILNTWLPF